MRRLAALLVVARRAAALRPPTRMKRTTALNAAVEVEEKFAASIEPEALEKRVRELGGEVLRTVEFYDEYFDTEELTLTTRDTWLRRRDGASACLGTRSTPGHAPPSAWRSCPAGCRPTECNTPRSRPPWPRSAR